MAGRREPLFPVRRTEPDEDIPARFREARTSLPPGWQPSLRQLRRWQKQAARDLGWLTGDEPRRWDERRWRWHHWRWHHWITHPRLGYLNWRRYH